MIEIFTDGSSRTVPKIATGYASVITKLEDKDDTTSEILEILVESSLSGTNQTAELNAFYLAKQGLIKLLESDRLEEKVVRIVSDSRYAINCMTGWRKIWENPEYFNQDNGKSLSKEDKIICNWLLIKDLWSEFDELKRLKFKIYFFHVRGHGKNKDANPRHIWGNDLADKYATIESKNALK